MSNIILPYEKTKTKLGEKDCKDFCPLKDGTLTGDPKYCWYSFICKEIGMVSDYYNYTGPGLIIEDGIIKETWYDNLFDYFCTGMIAKSEDIGTDKEVS